MSLVDLKIDYKEIAQQIEKTGGWGEINGRASFIGNEFGVHKFHIFPETVESFIESGGRADFAMSKMAKRFRLSDYPCVRVRAFNTKSGIMCLLEFMSFIGGLLGEIFEPGQKGAVDSTASTKSQSIGMDFANFIKKIPNKLINGLGAIREKFQEMVSNPDFYYRQLPNALSFTIQGSEENNIYTLPLINLDRIVSVNGDFGWNTDGILSKIIGFAKGFLMTPLQPFFIPEIGMGDEYPSVTLSFPLFNDTLEHAKDNYKFIHTILPWNMWVQWGMAVIPPVLYDISIDGGLRMKACSGRMGVSYLGTMREVDPSWKDAMGEVVTVPDAYVLTCRFESILNSNFNHYLLSWGEDEMKAIGKQIQRDVERERGVIGQESGFTQIATLDQEDAIMQDFGSIDGASNIDMNKYVGGGGVGGMPVGVA